VNFLFWHGCLHIQVKLHRTGLSNLMCFFFLALYFNCCLLFIVLHCHTCCLGHQSCRTCFPGHQVGHLSSKRWNFNKSNKCNNNNYTTFFAKVIIFSCLNIVSRALISISHYNESCFFREVS